jgi:hypothetical protein
VPVARSPSSPRRVCCLGELRLDVSNPGYPSVCPLPLYFPLLTLIDPPPPLTQGLVVSLSPFKGPGDSPRGNQPTPAPIFPLSALGCARLLAGVELRRGQATSPWTATLQCPCAGAVPMATFAILPQTSLSPSRCPGAPGVPAPSSPEKLHHGHGRRRHWRLGSPR